MEQPGSDSPVGEFSEKAAPSALRSGRQDGGRTESAASCLLSLKDICTLELIPDLAEAGISSLKIEGRMKRPEYAAGTVSIYRKMLDYYRDHGREGYQVDEEDIRALADLYNRGGFSEGYYGGRNGRSMMFPDRPNHYGTDAARVLSGERQAGGKYPGKSFGERSGKSFREKSGKGKDYLRADNSHAENVRVCSTHSVRKSPAVSGGGRILAEAIENLYAGDSLEIGGKEYSLTEDVKKGGTFTLPLRGASVPAGTVLRRVHAGHLLDSLKEKYVDTEVQVPVFASLRMHAGEQAELTVSCTGVPAGPSAAVGSTLLEQSAEADMPQRSAEADMLQHSACGLVSVTVRSEEIVQEASQRPLTRETIARQICKSGGTAFAIAAGADTLKADLDPNIFFSLRSLNELRRSALDALRERMLAPYRRPLPDAAKSFFETSETQETSGSYEKAVFSGISAALGSSERSGLSYDSEERKALSVSASVMTAEQLRTVLEHSSVERVYLDLSLLDGAASPGSSAREMPAEEVRAGEEDRGMLAEKTRLLLQLRDKIHAAGKKCFVTFPPVWRLDTVSSFEAVVPRDVLLSLDGALLQSYDQFEYIRRLKAPGSFTVVADAGLYTWNRLSRQELNDLGVDLDTIPAELTFREIRSRSFVPGLPASELVVYGRQRLMVTAQCLTKNSGCCRYPVKNGNVPPHGWGVLTDRKGAEFPVRRSCLFCMNEIFNSVPLELISLGGRVRTAGAGSVRLAFTTEGAEKAGEILDLTEKVFVSGENLPEDALKKAVPERTGGHFINKVE